MHVRFAGRALKIAAAVIAVAGISLIPLLSEAAWDGRASIPLEFVVLDASTGHPVEGAMVRLAEDHPEYQAATGPDGRARFVVEATVSGRDSLIRRTRAVNYAWALLIVRDDYRPVSMNLREATREAKYHTAPIPPPIVVRLEQSR